MLLISTLFIVYFSFDMFRYCGTPWGFDVNSWLSLTPCAIQNSHVPFYLIARNSIQIKMLTGFSQKNQS